LAKRDQTSGINRRGFFGGSAAALGAMFVATRDSTTESVPLAVQAARERRANPGVMALLAPLCVDGHVGPNYVIASARVVDGTAAVILENEGGARLRLDVCARDDAAPGVATTEHYGVYVCNGGKGDKATREAQGLIAMALAEAIRKNETTIERLPLATKTASWSA
jgi:hypothetical protein